jgi:hypothetical protein
MDNVKQMLSVVETAKVSNSLNDSRVDLVSMTIETTDPTTQLLRTRLTVLFIGEFVGPAGVSDLVFRLDEQLIGQPFLMNTESAEITNRSFLVFHDGVPTGEHRLVVQLRRQRDPLAGVGLRSLTVWETVVPRTQPGPGGEVVVDPA